MIPSENVRTVKTNGVMAGAEFGISLADSAHIMTILRDTLYSDKILAVLREYSANAWDSHRTSGKADLPIKVRLPTLEDPILLIRDFGKGLSRDEVFKIYTQYGASTKRDQDIAVGMLGIGSKSGFAYSDTFTVTSYFGGVKSVYSAMLDPSDKGVINLIAEAPCGEETGIAIEIPIKREDFEEFEEKAKTLFVHFDPRPDINCEIKQLPSLLGKFPAGSLYSESPNFGGSAVIAVMGCVPYKVNLYQVKDFEEGLPSFAFGLNAVLNFDIGEVSINASREELKYSDKTKKAIISKINRLVEEYVRSAVKTIKDPSCSPWSRRLAAQDLSQFEIFLPKEILKYTESFVNIKDKIPVIKLVTTDSLGKNPTETSEQLFWFGNKTSRTQVNHIPVRPTTRIIIKDDSRSIRGFNLEQNDFVLYFGKTKPSPKEVEDALAKVIEDAEMTGITVLKASGMDWSPRISNPTNRSGNKKHAKKFFRYVPQASWRRREKRPSDNWEVVERVPTEEDVYVEINGFKTVNGILEYNYRSDVELLQFFKVPVPEIYGYKVKENQTQKRPGLTYDEWRKKIAEQISRDPLFIAAEDHLMWDEATRTGQLDQFRYAQNVGKNIGQSHPVAKFFQNVQDKGFKRRVQFSNVHGHVKKVYQILGISENARWLESEFVKTQDEIKKTYPLFSCKGFNFGAIGIHSDMDKWIDYILLVDSKEKKDK